jgi:hypothetical protein
MNPIIRKLAAAAALAATLVSPLGHADDIDLYTGGEAATGAQANVLIVLDSSANWNANLADGVERGKTELIALQAIAKTLGDNINVGLALASGNQGGHIRFAIREMNNTNRPVFINMLNQAQTDFGTASDRTSYWQVAASDTPYEGMLNAAFRYFNGLARFGTTDLPQGSDPDMRDFNGNNNSSTRQPAFPNGLGGYSLGSVNATTYAPPASVSSGCAKNYIIFIGNGYPSNFDPLSDLTDAGALLGDTPDISHVSGGDNGSASEEWTRYMYKYGVKTTIDDPKSTTSPKAKLRNKISTYTIDVCKGDCTTGQEPNQTTVLKGMAKEGGGKYFKATDSTAISNALALIFAEIQAVNSVFASATLPISVNTQGTYENQVYIGVFRPDASARPRWYGNLKEYKFGRYCDVDASDTVLIDSTRALVNGMIPATLTGTATGAVTGTFSGNITNAAGTVTAVSGTVAGTVAYTTSATLAATFGSSPGTTASPAASLGSGTVTGTITDGSGGSSTFTGTLNATSSLSGTKSATDERIGDDVPAPSCGTGVSLKLYLSDQNGYRAIDETGNTGFIDLSAKSYWTSDSTFWTATPNTTSNNTGSSDLADGPTVERGGAAQRLRTHWAETAASGHPDGRKVYTCVGNCLLSSGTASEKALSNNVFASTNTTVAGLLAAPSGSASVTLARSGDTVTATSSAAHGFSDAESIVIAGATPTAYNGTKTITYVDATHFTYALSETPATSETVTAAKVGTVTSTTGTLNTTTAGSAVTITLAAPTGLTPGALTATISGTSTGSTALDAVLFGVKTGTVTAGGLFTYTGTLPSNPAASVTSSFSIKCGSGTTETATSGTWSSGQFVFTGAYTNGNCKNFKNGTIVVSGTAADTGLYSGTYTVPNDASYATISNDFYEFRCRRCNLP